ncbi:Bifunctional inhibitor/plant lipid transfer protein/seed storage helical domain containing protein [Parasponia andersonii]|uniref:Bifunctional inhibitor/plant lipid transfer protein/seed storage helical domain containing protein n=1 Tax=Parasponia andersonii TaxID=3476 RepID=A0A2P5DW53_PARAD|nr:Bifunctional inhibitor/plant lipid transfer protein/seed storage helical domain containing protein [Parasponia andersonii]
MKKLSFLALCVVVVSAAVVLFSQVPKAEALNCSPFQLIWCLPVITRGTRPSDLCCTKLDEQEPCLCGYIKNPNLQHYLLTLETFLPHVAFPTLNVVDHSAAWL